MGGGGNMFFEFIYPFISSVIVGGGTWSNFGMGVRVSILKPK